MGSVTNFVGTSKDGMKKKDDGRTTKEFDLPVNPRKIYNSSDQKW